MMKFLLRLATLARRSYWWAFRPVTKGVRAIFVDPTGSVLLVRHKYSDGWFLPGGGVRGREREEDALLRELKEELGMPEALEVSTLGIYQNDYEYKRDTITVFVVRVPAFKASSGFEIDSFGFFAPGVLPAGVSPGTRKRIEEWLGKRPTSEQW